MKKCFLGGTCNGSKWREYVMPYLKIDYFNPVVEDWTPECQAREIKEREECDYVLYVITPKMTGVYSIAEVVDDSNKRPEKTIFCIVEIDRDENDNEIRFNKAQLKSLQSVKKMVENNKAKAFDNLNDVIVFLNKQ